MIWRGVFTVSATPFAPDGALDLNSLYLPQELPAAPTA